jgi:hypothetical protein
MGVSVQCSMSDCQHDIYLPKSIKYVGISQQRKPLYERTVLLKLLLFV